LPNAVVAEVEDTRDIGRGHRVRRDLHALKEYVTRRFGSISKCAVEISTAGKQTRSSSMIYTSPTRDLTRPVYPTDSLRHPARHCISAW
jgi:hypothetical protein